MRNDRREWQNFGACGLFVTYFIGSFLIGFLIAYFKFKGSLSFAVTIGVIFSPVGSGVIAIAIKIAIAIRAWLLNLIKNDSKK